MKKDEIKTVKLSIPVWKAVSQMKLDNDDKSLDDTIKRLLENAGYC